MIHRCLIERWVKTIKLADRKTRLRARKGPQPKLEAFCLSVSASFIGNSVAVLDPADH
jgi:hypothetical protein